LRPALINKIDPQVTGAVVGDRPPDPPSREWETLLTFLKKLEESGLLLSDPWQVGCKVWWEVIIANSSSVGHDWTGYRVAVQQITAKIKALDLACDEFPWDGTPQIGPSEIQPNYWLRLKALLIEIATASGRVVPEPFGSIPEFDAEFHTALKLVQNRTRTAMARFDEASAAINSVKGKPRGSHALKFARALRVVWERATGKKATVSRASGSPTGNFVDFCLLSSAILPDGARASAAITPEVAAKATRKPVAESPVPNLDL
jgi:hypothetical protein